MPLKVLKTVTVAKGVTMALQENTDEPDTSIEKYPMDTTADGKEDSEVLYVPPHWHKHHGEFLTVLEGRMEIKLEGVAKIVEAGDPPAYVPPRTTHTMKGFKGERLVLREQADPAGIYKALFFNDIMSQGSFAGFWQIARAFYDGDAYFALPLGIKWVDEVFITIVGGFAHLIAPRRVEHL